MRRLFSRLVVVLACTAIYILYTGALTGLTVLTGLLTSAILVMAFDRLLIQRGVGLRDAVRVAYVLKYVALFIAAELKEHLRMVGIVLRGDGRVSPEVVEVPLDIETDLGVALLALTITSMPGTVAIHFDKSRRTLYVHWLTARRGSVEEVKREILGDFERLAKRIFG